MKLQYFSPEYLDISDWRVKCSYSPNPPETHFQIGRVILHHRKSLFVVKVNKLDIISLEHWTTQTLILVLHFSESTLAVNSINAYSWFSVFILHFHDNLLWRLSLNASKLCKKTWAICILQTHFKYLLFNELFYFRLTWHVNAHHFIFEKYLTEFHHYSVALYCINCVEFALLFFVITCIGFPLLHLAQTADYINYKIINLSVLDSRSKKLETVGTVHIVYY